MDPEDLSPDQRRKYERNTASRARRGLNRLEPEDWQTRSDRVSRNRRRGNEYRNSIYKAMEERGYNKSSGWGKETPSQTPGQEASRRLFEEDVLLGHASKGFTLEQREKYERNRASRESRGLKPLEPQPARPDRLSQ